MQKAIITKETLTQLFSTYPAADILYITSDGQAFFEPHAAGGHAQRLKVDKVVSITRGEFNSGEAKSFAEGLAEVNIATGDNHIQGLFGEFLKLERDNEPVIIKTTSQQFMEAIHDRMATKGLLAALDAPVVIMLNDEVEFKDEHKEALLAALKEGGSGHIVTAPTDLKIEPVAPIVAPVLPADKPAAVTPPPAEPTSEQKAAAKLAEAYATPADQRSGHQKGLITKAENAAKAAAAAKPEGEQN